MCLQKYEGVHQIRKGKHESVSDMKVKVCRWKVKGGVRLTLDPSLSFLPGEIFLLQSHDTGHLMTSSALIFNLLLNIIITTINIIIINIIIIRTSSPEVEMVTMESVPLTFEVKVANTPFILDRETCTDKPEIWTIYKRFDIEVYEYWVYEIRFSRSPLMACMPFILLTQIFLCCIWLNGNNKSKTLLSLKTFWKEMHEYK